MWRLRILSPGPDIHVSSWICHVTGLGEMGYHVAVLMYAIEYP